MKTKLCLAALVLILVLSGKGYSQTESIQTTWKFDKTGSMGGYETTPLTRFPVIIDTDRGKAFLFNGIDQAMLIGGNPLGNASSFTIEILFRPDSSLNPANLEQRFLHVAKTKDEKPRILMELRLLKNQRWALDTYIGSDSSSSTLLDTVNPGKLHPAGRWYHVALVFENKTITNYINGKVEHSDKVDFLPLPDAIISVGARQNPRSWFKGVIKTVRFTKRALKPNEFLK